MENLIPSGATLALEAGSTIEGEVKHSMIKNSDKNILLIGSSKFNDIQDIDIIVTDDTIEMKPNKQFSQLELNVMQSNIELDNSKKLCLYYLNVHSTIQ